MEWCQVRDCAYFSLGTCLSSVSGIDDAVLGESLTVDAALFVAEKEFPSLLVLKPLVLVVACACDVLLTTRVTFL